MSKLETLQKELVKQGYNIKKASEVIDLPKLRTGIFALDDLLSGGISQCEGGHRIEFWGGESTGKTTFCLHIIKAYQKLGKACVFVDAEDSFDATWATMIGVDLDNLLILKPFTLEELGDMLSTLVKTVDLVIIDSIVSMIPEPEIERKTNEPTMALQARINSLISKKLYHALTDELTTVIFINQMRQKVGVMYGSPDTSGGGKALLHLYNTRVQFRSGKPIDEGTGDNKERIGHEIHMKCIKNKRGIPYKTTSLDLYIDGRIDNKKSLFYAGLKHGIIERTGNNYSFGEDKILGKDNFLEQFKEWDKLEKKIWEKLDENN